MTKNMVEEAIQIVKAKDNAKSALAIKNVLIKDLGNQYTPQVSLLTLVS